MWLANKLRPQNPHHDCQVGSLHLRQVGSCEQPLTQRLLDAVRAVDVAEQSRHRVEFQAKTLALQQEDCAVPQVALEMDNQPVEQSHDLRMGLECCQAIEHRSDS